MVFQQNRLEKAYFIAKMSGLAMIRRAGQFWLLESALKADKSLCSLCERSKPSRFTAPSVQERGERKFRLLVL